MNFNSAILFLLLSIGLVSCQWGGGWNSGYGGYNGYNNGGYGGYGGGYNQQQAMAQNAANIGTQVAEQVLVAEEVQSAMGVGGWGK